MNGNEGLTFLDYFDDFSVLMFVVGMVLSCLNLEVFLICCYMRLPKILVPELKALRLVFDMSSICILNFVFK